MWSFTYVLFQVCDVFSIFRQGLEDFQPIGEIFVGWLIVSDHLEKVGSQRAESLTLYINREYSF